MTEQSQLCGNCSFCGAVFKPGSNELRSHIFQCDRHPATQMLKALRKVDADLQDGPGPLYYAPTKRAVQEAIAAAEQCINPQLPFNPA